MLVTIPMIIVAGVLAWLIRPREGLSGSGRLAIPATIIPPCLVAVAAVIVQLLYNATGVAGISDLSNTLFVIGLGLIGIAILVLVVFAVKRKGDMVKAIGFGTCIDVIVYILVFGLLEWLAGV